VDTKFRQGRHRMTISSEDFLFYKKFLYESSGYDIREDKVYLLVSRLTPILKKWNLSSLQELTTTLRFKRNKDIEVDVIDAMTTNETLFFRDDRPFKYLRLKLLPDLVKQKEVTKSLKIWSAASSTGQEPYSIAITLLEGIPLSQTWNINIIATDISNTVLAQAAKGEFSQFEIQRGMPAPLLIKYFKQDGLIWKISDNVKKMVRFEYFNLLEPMEKFGAFDIIFCRNVLIYFDEVTKKKILQKLAKRVVPGGYIFLGGTETVLGLVPELKSVPECPGLFTVQKV
jgi:chemotaxis protein methyltransferase CheR